MILEIKYTDTKTKDVVKGFVLRPNRQKIALAEHKLMNKLHCDGRNYKVERIEHSIPKLFEGVEIFL